jgi:plastocyanin
MAGNSWSINIVKGNPCTFQPDVYCPPDQPKPTVLTAQANDQISWNNLTGQVHQICTGQGAEQTQLTRRIPANGSSDAYSPQTSPTPPATSYTIDYYCCLHTGETGTIEVVS